VINRTNKLPAIGTLSSPGVGGGAWANISNDIRIIINNRYIFLTFNFFANLQIFFADFEKK
jgi:hypothetical protein